MPAVGFATSPFDELVRLARDMRSRILCCGPRGEAAQGQEDQEDGQNGAPRDDEDEGFQLVAR